MNIHKDSKALVPILLLIIAAAFLKAVSWAGPLAPSGRGLSQLLIAIALVLMLVFGPRKLKP